MGQLNRRVYSKMHQAVWTVCSHPFAYNHVLWLDAIPCKAYSCMPTGMSCILQAFINVATAGFGSDITTKTDPAMKKQIGGVAYLVTGQWHASAR